MFVECCSDRVAFCSQGRVTLADKIRFSGRLGNTLLDLLDRRLLDDGASLYSLIDGAKFSRLARMVSAQNASIELFSLLGEAAATDAVYAGPILIRHKTRELCALLLKLMGEQDSASFMSLIVSNQPLADTLKRLVWLTEVRHEDGTEWVMRFYDPLILPHWLAVLDAKQRQQALSGTMQWLFTDVRGENRAVDIASVDSTPLSETRPMLLMEQQSDDLMTAAMPYIVVHQLCGDNPQAIDAIPSTERYDFFYRQIESAKKLGVVAPGDVKMFCLLATMFGPEFSKHQLVSTAVQGVDMGNSFTEHVLSWTSEEWDLLEKELSSL